MTLDALAATADRRRGERPVRGSRAWVMRGFDPSTALTSTALWMQATPMSCSNGASRSPVRLPPRPQPDPAPRRRHRATTVRPSGRCGRRRHKSEPAPAPRRHSSQRVFHDDRAVEAHVEPACRLEEDRGIRLARPRSSMTTPSTRTSNMFSTPAAASTAKEFLLAEITPCGCRSPKALVSA